MVILPFVENHAVRGEHAGVEAHPRVAQTPHIVVVALGIIGGLVHHLEGSPVDMGACVSATWP